MGWIFLTPLKVNMDSSLCDAAPVCNVQRCLEELEQCVLTLEQEPCGPEEPSISDSKAVSDSDDEHYEIKDNDDGRCETENTCLAARPVVQQKVKHEQPMAWVDILKGSPM